MMGHVWGLDGKAILVAKGSPESIIPLCHLSDEDIKAIENHQIEMASKGYRVIAVAINDNMQDIPKNLNENQMKIFRIDRLSRSSTRSCPRGYRCLQ